jgi:hypothetical protein
MVDTCQTKLSEMAVTVSSKFEINKKYNIVSLAKAEDKKKFESYTDWDVTATLTE